MNIDLNKKGKQIGQLFCRHRWPKIYFKLDEYEKEYTCPKCGKLKRIHSTDRPEYMNVLPTDYYENKLGRDES
jgi:hypothetical protein